MCVCTAVGMCSSTCILCTAFRMSTRANVPSLPYHLRSSVGYHGRCTYSPVLVPRAGTSFVQCFAWSAKRGQMCLVCLTPYAVRLGITDAEHARPCWYLCWYLFRTVLCLGSPGNVSLARARTRTGTPLAQFGWVSRVLYILARVGTCAGTSFVQCFAWAARAMYHLPGLVLVLVRPLRSSLGYHGC